MLHKTTFITIANNAFVILTQNEHKLTILHLEQILLIANSTRHATITATVLIPVQTNQTSQFWSHVYKFLAIIKLHCIRCKKPVQESMTDMQVSCASRLVQVSSLCVISITPG